MQAHGVLLTVTFVVILPISVVIAHSMRSTWGPNLWFQIHRALGVSHLLLSHHLLSVRYLIHILAV